MLRIERYFAKLLLLCIILAPAFAAAAQEQERKDSALPDSVDVAVDEMIEEMVESAQPAADNALKYLELLSLVDPEHREGHNERGERRAKHEHRIGLFQVWRIMNEVELTDEQVDKFFPLMRKMMKSERELAGKKRDLVKSLREELKKEKPSEAELKRLMTEIKNQAKLAWQQRVDNQDQFAGLLTVEQQARLLLSLNEVEKDIWESIARVKMAPMIKPEFKFDREKLDRQMKELRKNLDSLNIRLKLKLPGIPEYIEDIDEDEESEEKQP